MLAIAVGNSSTSAVLWTAAGRMRRAWRWPTAWPPRRAVARLRAGLRARRIVVVLAGVVPDRTAALEHALRRSLCAGPRVGTVLRFRRGLPCQLQIRPRPARRVGDDRLAAALGALALDPAVPWVVLDAGTALTINAVRPAARGRAGVFEGGLIVPGEALALRALASGTAQLPALKPWGSSSAPTFGRSTSDAMRAGVRAAQLAAALTLARAQARALGRRTRAVLTGGGAPALWSALRKSLREFRPVHDPRLVERGLHAAWLEWERTS